MWLTQTINQQLHYTIAMNFGTAIYKMAKPIIMGTINTREISWQQLQSVYYTMTKTQYDLTSV